MWLLQTIGKNCIYLCQTRLLSQRTVASQSSGPQGRRPPEPQRQKPPGTPGCHSHLTDDPRSWHSWEVRGETTVLGDGGELRVWDVSRKDRGCTSEGKWKPLAALKGEGTHPDFQEERELWRWNWDLPGGAVVKNPPANAGDLGLILVREDSTCHGATKPTSHNYWAHTLQLLKPARLEPMLRNKRSHHNEEPAHHNKE